MVNNQHEEWQVGCQVVCHGFPGKKLSWAVSGRDLALAQIKSFPLFISSSKFWQCEAGSSITAKALERRKRLSYVKSCLYFSGWQEGASVNRSPDLDQHRNMDLLWRVTTAVPAVVLDISVREVGTVVEERRGSFCSPYSVGARSACSVFFAVGRKGLEGAVPS